MGRGWPPPAGLAVLTLLLLVVAVLACQTQGLATYAAFKARGLRELPARVRLAQFYRMLALIGDYTKGLPVWLEYGSLLGAYRADSIICYDHDLDMGVYEPDFAELCVRMRRLVADHPEYAYASARLPPFVIKGVLMHMPSGLGCDFYVRAADADGRTRLILSWTKDVYPCDWRAPTGAFLPLRPHALVDPEGRRYPVLIPRDARGRLECQYGKDFMIPSHVCDDQCENCRPRL